MTRALAILLISAASMHAGYLDITGAEVETNGWILKLWAEGMTTNGTFASGFGTNNSLSAPKLRVDIESPGFDQTGTSNAVRRTVYGTQIIRRAYPNEQTNDIQRPSTHAVVKIALSDYVYAGDYTVTLTLLAGAYYTTNTSTTNCNAVSALTVTNSSVQPYPKVIANWTWPGWNRETNSTIRLRACGFHAAARNGQPLACLKFIATDESGDAVSSIQTAMQMDRSLPDAVPFGEYIADLSQSSFANGDAIRCDFVAYPWIGTTAAVLDTTLDLYQAPMACSITNLCDRLNSYTDLIAVVDLNTGSDSNGRPTNVAPASVNSAHYFKTIAGAANMLAASNSTSFGHPDSGGTFIYVRSGVTNFPAGTVNSNVVPKAWVTVLAYPGHSVSLTNTSSSSDINDRVKVQGVHLGFVGSQIPFSGMQRLWLDQCTIGAPGVGPFQATDTWVTHCTVTQLVQGFRASSIGNNEFFRLRGNTLSNFNHTLLVQTVIGNRHPDTNGQDYIIRFDLAGQGARHDMQILYNNYFGGSAIGSGTELLHCFGSFVLTNGAAIVQNVFERTGNSGSPAANLASSGNLASTNLILWHNLFLGERIADYGSSGTETATIWRNLWSQNGNIFDLTGFKKDWNTPSDSDRIGNWPLMWQVNGSGNMWVECRVNSAAGGFPPDFAGINSHHPPGSGTNIINFPRFINRKAYDGGTATAGGGDYRMHSDSPGFALSCERRLPFDSAGVPRGRIDPPGAFVAGNRRKGFF